MISFGSLFAGIGGFDLGFERAGFACSWQVERDPFCRTVLAKHWPRVPRYSDIRDVEPELLEPVEVVLAGFPCQDVSLIGSKEGIDGKRSGLFGEALRIFDGIKPRPKYLVLENVASLLSRGLDSVLCQLAERGLHAEWRCYSGTDFGAPHQRRRIFIVAYSDVPRCPVLGAARIRCEAGSEDASGDDAHGRSARMGRTFPPGPRARPEAFPRLDQPAVLRVAYGAAARMDRRRLNALGNHAANCGVHRARTTARGRRRRVMSMRLMLY